MTKKLIPFSRELYEKGYRAVRRDGLEVLGVFFDESLNCPERLKVVCIYRKQDRDISGTRHYNNGKCEADSGEDLLLEAKTIDLYMGIDQDSEGNIRSSHPILNKEELQGWNSIVKITVDAETLEQIV